jgi:hypothetical protein
MTDTYNVVVVGGARSSVVAPLWRGDPEGNGARMPMVATGQPAFGRDTVTKLLALMRDRVECMRVKPLLQSYLDGYLTDEDAVRVTGA